jgi:hypothetical protein
VSWYGIAKESRGDGSFGLLFASIMIVGDPAAIYLLMSAFCGARSSWTGFPYELWIDIAILI